MRTIQAGRAAGLLVALASAAGCASAGHLADYDFRDRSVAVVTVAPPHPDVFTDEVVDLGGTDLAGALMRIGIQKGRARAQRLRAGGINRHIAQRSPVGSPGHEAPGHPAACVRGADHDTATGHHDAGKRRPRDGARMSKAAVGNNDRVRPDAVLIALNEAAHQLTQLAGV